MAAVEPVMSVHFNGKTHLVKVKPGEEGRQAFIQDVRRLLRLKESQSFDITFECRLPGHGLQLDLKGLSAYDAAVFCAAMTAAERQRMMELQAATRAAATTDRSAGHAAARHQAQAEEPSAPSTSRHVAPEAASRPLSDVGRSSGYEAGRRLSIPGWGVQSAAPAAPTGAGQRRAESTPPASALLQNRHSSAAAAAAGRGLSSLSVPLQGALPAGHQEAPHAGPETTSPGQQQERHHVLQPSSDNASGSSGQPSPHHAHHAAPFAYPHMRQALSACLSRPTGVPEAVPPVDDTALRSGSASSRGTTTSGPYSMHAAHGPEGAPRLAQDLQLRPRQPVGFFRKLLGMIGRHAHASA